MTAEKLDAIHRAITTLDAVKHNDFYQINADDPDKSIPVDSKTFVRGSLTMVAHIDAKHTCFTVVEYDEGHAGLYGYIYSTENLVEKYRNKYASEFPDDTIPFNEIETSPFKNWYKGTDDLE